MMRLDYKNKSGAEMQLPALQDSMLHKTDVKNSRVYCSARASTEEGTATDGFGLSFLSNSSRNSFTKL